jgi:hypothetical protein
MNTDTGRSYFRVMALFYLGFGLATTFYPRFLQLFMTERGIDASTSFSDQVWLHGGLDILSISLLLLAFSTVPVKTNTIRLAAIVPLFPAAAIVYTLIATPFWTPLFLLPAAGCFAFAVYGFVLSRNYSNATVASATIGD